MEKWGLIVRENNPTPTKGGVKIEFKVIIAKSSEKKSRDVFFSSDKVAEYVRNREFLYGGVCSVLVNSATKKIRWISFTPFSITTTLNQLGLASTIQAAIVQRLKLRFPSYRIRSAKKLEPERTIQLRKMRINPKKEYPIEEYYRLTQHYLKSAFKRKGALAKPRPRIK